MIPLILTPAVTSALCVLAARTMGIGLFADTQGERDEETELEPASSTSAIDELKNMDMDQLVSVLVEKIGQRSPEVIKVLRGIDKEDAISETIHAIYMEQVALAQAYLNENHQADLSRVQCLLRKMLPEPYHRAIADLRENQDPSVIYNIFGGVHQHAPNATKAEQKKYVRRLAPRT